MAVLGNGEEGFEFAKLISKWSNDVTLFTNGLSTLSHGQEQKLFDHNIHIIEEKIAAVNCIAGNVQTINLIVGSEQRYNLYLPG
ncbi:MULTISPECIES: hypothetical protein [unclassified Mucilaginibacter]|uniref:hypothetical protein n=1 Tax=unclassified Mucilaginibacter TaxID=2617802 RepID=UPI002AC8B227|nr:MULTISPECIES: hypothetical protein [unclassified Mucilaginibacter]MEB0261395.1 hypothetical protein [Mucilaginibacter sp. 10I4]MEB0278846.1 hypothetical protein [Mucilaginibacter sp. 10B2]MEB0299788.1 hypothetical protein [Mucilaginibacter sp. 5C4]WPX22028.1 hypothetical protein RHM67_12135 [Mucilaginibacter sp. 5C4]